MVRINESSARVPYGEETQLRRPSYGYTSTRPVGYRSERSSTRNPNRKYNSDGDSLDIKAVKTEKEARQERIRQNRRKRAWTNRLLGAVMAISIMTGGGKVVDNMTAPHTNFDAQGHSVVEVADWTDVDYRAILLANNIKDKDTELEDIILPQQYSIYGEEIAELEAKLEKGKLKDEDKAEIEQQLEEYKEKQAALDEFAQVYVDEDGKYAYIIPNEYCSAEKLKDVFGIEDGVLKDNNDLSYDWGSNEYGGYKDYTSSGIPHRGVKVPMNKLFKAN